MADSIATINFSGIWSQEQEDPLLGAADASRWEHGGHAQGAREADPAGGPQGASREGEDEQAPLLTKACINLAAIHGQFRRGLRP